MLLHKMFNRKVGSLAGLESRADGRGTIIRREVLPAFQSSRTKRRSGLVVSVEIENSISSGWIRPVRLLCSLFVFIRVERPT